MPVIKRGTRVQHKAQRVFGQLIEGEVVVVNRTSYTVRWSLPNRHGKTETIEQRVPRSDVRVIEVLPDVG